MSGLSSTSFADIHDELSAALEHERVCAEWARLNQINLQRLTEWLARVQPALQALAFKRQPLSALILKLFSVSSSSSSSSAPKSNANQQLRDGTPRGAVPAALRPREINKNDHGRGGIPLCNSESAPPSAAPSSAAACSATPAKQQLHQQQPQQQMSAFAAASVAAIQKAYQCALGRTQKDILESRLCDVALISQHIFTTSPLPAACDGTSSTAAAAAASVPSGEQQQQQQQQRMLLLSSHTFFFNKAHVPASLDAVHRSIRAALPPEALQRLVPLISIWIAGSSPESYKAEIRLEEEAQQQQLQRQQQQKQPQAADGAADKINASSSVSAQRSRSSSAAGVSSRRQLLRNSELEVHWRRRRAMAVALLSAAASEHYAAGTDNNNSNNNNNQRQQQHPVFGSRELREPLRNIVLALRDMHEQRGSACVPLTPAQVMQMTQRIGEAAQLYPTYAPPPSASASSIAAPPPPAIPLCGPPPASMDHRFGGAIPDDDDDLLGDCDFDFEAE